MLPSMTGSPRRVQDAKKSNEKRLIRIGDCVTHSSFSPQQPEVISATLTQEGDCTWVVVEDDVEEVLVSPGDVVLVLLIKRV